MTFDHLISICKPETVSGDEPDAIGSLQQDSRLIRKADVFLAVRGLIMDGHDFIGDAVARGASAVICEELPALNTGGAVFIRVESTRKLAGQLAQAFQGYPSADLSTVAVTGTNGKTTVATLVWQVLQKMGVKSGLLGTVAKQYGDERSESRLTTADPVEIAADMRKMVNVGCTSLAMEVSSHALEQKRTDGINWNIAAFTNLSHDHLDYHGDMNRYVAAKRKLFDSLDRSACAVVNADDPCGPEMVKNCRAKIIYFSFGKEASVRCKLHRSDETGLHILVGDTEIFTPLTGLFNAYNVAEAFLICRELGYNSSRISGALRECGGAPGRLEKVTLHEETAIKPAVFVDYAHTPDALANVASTLEGIRKKDQLLVILFGCGGDRDMAKRPEMAKVAETYAGRIMVTSDNPRNEDPEKIIRDIEGGFYGSAEWTSVTSRKEAIRRAVLEAPANAIVLIAGKGHETVQEIGGKRMHFDDRDVARKALDQYNGIKKQPEETG
ncbi:MAG: UDP-N-acetylmuramoyl-L-alanyl-D-glutamate--2,6-diaminopimelate ligase [Balneolaceae bacterium]